MPTSQSANLSDIEKSKRGPGRFQSQTFLKYLSIKTHPGWNGPPQISVPSRLQTPYAAAAASLHKTGAPCLPPLKIPESQELLSGDGLDVVIDRAELIAEPVRSAEPLAQLELGVVE